MNNHSCIFLLELLAQGNYCLFVQFRIKEINKCAKNRFISYASLQCRSVGLPVILFFNCIVNAISLNGASIYKIKRTPHPSPYLPKGNISKNPNMPELTKIPNYLIRTDGLNI